MTIDARAVHAGQRSHQLALFDCSPAQGEQDDPDQESPPAGFAEDEPLVINPTTPGMPPCTSNQRLYLVALAVEPDEHDSRATWDAYTEAAEAARSLCEGCPIFTQCLTDAVLDKPIRGFVAGTSDTERRRMRGALGLNAEQGDSGFVRGVDHQRLASELKMHPDATTKEIADRAGCSERTVKRTRAAMREGRPQPVSRLRTRPDTETVVAAYRDHAAS